MKSCLWCPNYGIVREEQAANQVRNLGSQGIKEMAEQLGDYQPNWSFASSSNIGIQRMHCKLGIHNFQVICELWQVFRLFSSMEHYSGQALLLLGWQWSSCREDVGAVQGRRDQREADDRVVQTLEAGKGVVQAREAAEGVVRNFAMASSGTRRGRSPGPR